MVHDEVLHVFVYGTLQQGQSRAHLWPHRPRRVVPGRVRGTLYNLGPYPALLPGNDWVQGELWELAPEHLVATINRLDEVEGAEQLEGDLYRREFVPCFDTEGNEFSAYAYFYCLQVSDAQRIPCEGNDTCAWPKEHGP